MIRAINAILVILLASPSFEQTLLQTPCPNVFEYEPAGNDAGRWDGVVHLSTDSILHSLWLHIVLDCKADMLGNWVGNVTTKDYTYFKIENSEMKIYPGPAVPVRFFVTFNPLKKVPKLQAILMNGREICNADTPQSSTDRLDNYCSCSPISEQSLSNMHNTKPLFGNPPGEAPIYVTSAIPLVDQNNVSNDSNKPDPNESSNDVQPTLSVPDSSANNNTDKNNSNSLNNRIKQDECGKVVKAVHPLVVNGKSTQEKQWPWQIALYQTETVENKYLCGGTLISLDHVITAAHCVTWKGSRRVVNKHTLVLYFGTHNRRTSIDGVQVRLVKEIIRHPEYNTSSFVKDVSILKLREPVQYTEYVRPACLWPENLINLNNVIGKNGSVVGWGIDNTGVATEELTLAEMPVVDQETCIRSHVLFFGRFTSEYTFCAGSRDGGRV